MYINEKYMNEFQMVNPHKDDIVSENAFPTTIQTHNIAWYLNKIAGCMSLRVSMHSYMEKCYTGKRGLYHQFPEYYMNKPTFANPKDKRTSKEQLMAMLCLKLMSHDYATICQIRHYLKKHWGCYNNLQDFYWPRYMGRQANLTAKYFENHSCSRIWDTEDALIDICNDQILRDRNKPDRSTGALKGFMVLSSIYVRFNQMEELRKLILICKPEFKEFYEDDHPIITMIEQVN